MRNPRDVLGKVGIVGAGGGYKGACIPGLLEPIFEAGIWPSYLGSLSVSALMFGKLSEAKNQSQLLDQLASIKEIWRRIEKRGHRSVFNFTARSLWNGVRDCVFLDNEPLFRLLEDFDPKESISSPIQSEFFVCRTKTMSRETFSNHDAIFSDNPELLRLAIVASASLRPIFPTVKIGLEEYHDVGAISLAGAVAYGCDTIFVLSPYSATYERPKPPENFIGRHAPLFEEYAGLLAAAIRGWDKAEVEFPMELAELGRGHNLVVDAYEEEFRESMREKQELWERIGELEKQLGALKKGAPPEGWFRRLFGRSQPVSKHVVPVRQRKVFARAGCPRIIALHGEVPSTLTTKEFGAGDLTIAYEKSRSVSRRRVEELLR